jgi:putative phosphoesterase
MIRIGLLSDTHGFWDEKVKLHFKDCDEIWHAGDLGKLPEDMSFYHQKSFTGVYGNIDGGNYSISYPKYQIFQREALKIVITHIGGYPGKYTSFAKKLIRENKPDVFICGHSHILKIMKCPDWGHLHINPGAAGLTGFQPMRTMVRFSIKGDKIKDMEVIHFSR